jgi:DNA-binding MarR family transcriptional regulator
MPDKAAVADLEAHLGYWLRRVSNHVSGAFARSLQAEQVSVAEWVALRLIAGGEHMTPGKLAEAMGMTRGAVSKILDKLEAKDWVANVANPNDSRVQWLSLTRRGSRLLPRLAALAEKNDEHFFGCLDKSEHAALLRLLKKLTQFHRFNDTAVD